MSYLISGLNLSNIYEYDSAQSYEKYDIVDYQFVTGFSVYPNYTGFGNSGIVFFFNNDQNENFSVDYLNNVNLWKDTSFLTLEMVDQYGSGEYTSLNLVQNNFGDGIDYRPYIDFNNDYIVLKNNEFLSGSGMANLQTKTVFACFSPSQRPQGLSQNIFQFDGTIDLSDSGFLKITGINTSGYAKFLIDDQSFNSFSPIYDTPNIITLIQTSGTSGEYIDIEIRHNGYSIGNALAVYSGWTSGFFKIGPNSNPNGIKYHELFCFSGALSETEIDYYEKYLFEKYFSNEGLYFAKTDVPANELASPLSFAGSNYWTRDINDLFGLSYGCSANFSSNLASINFSDGYKSNVARTINNLNSSFDLKYDGLTDKEAKALIAYFENSPESKNKSIYEGFSGVNLNLFHPYGQNTEVYFLDIDHSTPYPNINTIKIKGENLYASNLDYKGMLVRLDETNIRTYSNELRGFEYNDVVYFESPSFSKRGYYFYTGADTDSFLSAANSPTGNSSYFTKNFYFKEDLDYDVSSQIRLIVAEYKGSTKEYIKDGINYNTLKLDLKFSNRSNRESRAILKFLDDKAGFKIFEYVLPQPYNKTINVYCPEWSHTYNFYDNNSISAKFIEVRKGEDATTNFDTRIAFTS